MKTYVIASTSVVSLTLLSVAGVAIHNRYPQTPEQNASSGALSAPQRQILRDFPLIQPGGLQQPPQPQQAGPYSAYQLPGRKFLIRGSTGFKGVTFYGVASGQAVSDSAGRIEAVLESVQLGQLRYLEADSSRFDPAANPVFPHLVPQPGDGQGSLDLTNLPPTVASASISQTGVGQYLVSGLVADDTPESRVGLVVNFEAVNQGVYGPVLGTAKVLSDGSFRIPLAIENSRPRPVPCRVSVTDWYGLTTTVNASIP